LYEGYDIEGRYALAVPTEKDCNCDIVIIRSDGMDEAINIMYVMITAILLALSMIYMK